MCRSATVGWGERAGLLSLSSDRQEEGKHSGRVDNTGNDIFASMNPSSDSALRRAQGREPWTGWVAYVGAVPAIPAALAARRGNLHGDERWSEDT